MRTPTPFFLMGYQKVAFTLDQVRKASKLTMANKGFTRGGRSLTVNLDGLSFSPIQRRVPPRTGMGTGPTGPMLEALPQTSHGPLELEESMRVFQGTHPDISPAELLTSPRIAPKEGIILGGGRHGTQSGALSGILPKELLPKTPQGKEVANRLGILHEGWEADALKQPANSMLDSARSWGNLAGLNTGHLNPSVILNESNAISTLPQGIKEDVLPFFRQARGMDPSWNLIQKGLGKEIPYGEQRFSRHAKKRMLEALKSTTTNDEYLKTILGN